MIKKGIDTYGDQSETLTGLFLFGKMKERKNIWKNLF